MAYEGLATIGACTKGDLPDRNQYDLYCPLMGGPDHKLNYCSTGCLERQRYDGCSAKNCQHRKGNIVKKKSIEPKARVYRLGEVVHGKKSAVCAECHQIRPIHGRGCCGGCYMRLQKDGTLDAKHPPKKGGRKKKDITPQKRVFVGTTPELVVTAGETAQHQEASMGTHKTIAACAQCDRTMTLIARGLCGKCYNAHKKAGTLDERYPAARLVRAGDIKESILEEVPSKGYKPSLEELARDYSEVSYSSVRSASDLGTGEIVESTTLAVTLFFEGNDEALAEYLEKWAKQDRRALEDQILFVLDKCVTDLINGSPA